MDTENKKLTAPSGKELEIRGFVTARARNELRSVFLKNVKVDPESAKPTIDALGGALLEEAEHKVIELIVVSFDGATEPAKILEALLNGTPEDYDFVVAEANKIGNFKPAK